MQKRLKSFIKNNWLIVGFLLVYFILVAYKIIYFPTPFYNWDESIYAQVGHEMMETRSFFVPLWQGNAWLDKPYLAPLVYGIVQSATPFIQPEISTRVFTLFISTVILLFVYIFYFRIVKDKIISVATVIITAFIPAFLQRAQVLNVDIFLVLGWLGYVLFFRKFWIGLFFLSIAVYSKSLVGFYPVLIFGIYFTYQILTKKISKKQFQANVKQLLLQSATLSLWYLGMFLLYGGAFWQSHFVDSHFKRVTASIESHFGQRTFYVDLLFSEFGLLIFPALLGVGFILFNYFKKRDEEKTFLSFFFIPWFIFLNLTKTKIAWYIYPVIHQFAFAGGYFLMVLKRLGWVYYVVFVAIITFVFYSNFANNKFFSTLYSSVDENYQLALFAKNHCKELDFVVDPESRKTHDTLLSMNLLITSSEWWGSHPRVVYYFGKKVNFIYDKDIFIQKISEGKRVDCLAIVNSDTFDQISQSGYNVEKSFGNLLLYRR